MQWFATAPANIALIKYMGKKDFLHNLPDNASLSYTLDNLLSTVSLELHQGSEDYWQPLAIEGEADFQLAKASQTRFLNHLNKIKALFAFSGSFIVRSRNNFPQGTGLASSASSFAALTKVAVLALSELQQQPLLSAGKQAQLSMQGSGSSCRSFFAPWALWQDKQVEAIEFPFKKLLHQVILISKDEKKIASSTAHQLVKTSPHYPERTLRASARLTELVAALGQQDWAAAYLLCWDEFQDMHRLFATAEQPFSYINKEAEQVLSQLQELWQQQGDGPLITMDAGPNIHLLYRQDQSDLALAFKQKKLVGHYDVL